MRKKKTIADYQVTPIPGTLRAYRFTGGEDPHEVKLNDFGGRGSCDCEQFKRRVFWNRRSERMPDTCIHIDAALDFEGPLPMFSPAV
jgi:hypothetical protein